MTEAQEKQANTDVEAIVRDGFAEINGREYHFGKLNFKKRLKVFAYASSIAGTLKRGDMSWMDSQDFAPIEKLFFDNVLFENMQLSKLPEHFDNYPQDYISLIPACIAVITYPLKNGNPTS